jgi:exonuclease SbcC
VEQLETDRINLNERIAAQRQLLQTRREEVEQAQGLINQLNAELASLAQPAQAADLENRITVYDEDAAHWQAVADGLSDAPTYLEAERAALAELNDPRSEQTRFRGIADQRPGVETEQQRLEYAKAALEGRHQKQEQALQAYAGLEQVLAEVNECLEQNKKTYQAYLANQKTASVHVQRLEFLETIRGQHTAQTALCAKLDTEWQAAQARYDAEQHAQLRNEIEQLGHEIARLDAQLDEWHRRHNELESEILQLRQQQVILDASRQELARLNHLAEVLKFVREGIRQAGPQVVRQRVKAISHSADRIFQDIIEAPSLRLSWDETYAIKVFCRREERLFNQLSGGEQMAAAIAVRLALMIQMSDLRILFLDEPTANLDDTRRDKLADRITSLEGLQQIFVITHDDAFRRDTHHFIQVSKQDGVSIVQVGG